MNLPRNPFKFGDKVVRLPEWHIASWEGHGHEVVTVTAINRDGILIDYGPPRCPESFDGWWLAKRFRAAVAGKDYPAPPVGDSDPPANSGHLPDGSSVQKHSAGPLYPVVLVYRDAKLGGGKYDVGIISPRNQEPLWFSTLDAAVAAATIIKEDLK